MTSGNSVGRGEGLPSWFVRVGVVGEAGRDGETIPTVRLTAPMGDGTPTTTIEVWAAEPDYRVSTAEANGRAVIVIRHPFCPCGRSGSEAERFLQVFEKRPDGVFDELRGEAVVILWDGEEGRLQAARAVGSTRPLFFGNMDGGLVLSDSMGTLFARGGIEPELNRELLVCYLANCWYGSDETYYAGVRRVPPAHALRWREGEASFRQFWDPLPVGRPIEWIEGEVLEQFDALFEQAIARSVGAGRTGVFLSGGLDSVSVAAVAADLARSDGSAPPLALSLAMPHPECDEREVQKGVAADLQIEQAFLGFDEAMEGRGFIERSLELSANWPSPLQNFWLPAYLRLAGLGSSHGCRTILTGTGGDEWLGISPFLSADYLKRLQLVRWTRFWRVFDRSYRLSRMRLIYNHAWTFGLRPLIARAVWAAAGGISTGARPAWMRWRRGRSLRGWIAPDPELRRALLDREEAAWAARAGEPPEDEYTRQSRLPISHMLVALEQEEIAEEGRRTGTLLRQPFFDPDLVAFLVRVRPEGLVRDGRAKGLVRDQVARRCPELGFESQRKSLGTGLFRERMQREIGFLWRQFGGARVLDEMGVVGAYEVQFLLERIEGGRADVRDIHRMWLLLSLEGWVRNGRSVRVD
jgi:asparagine synthetase B (glutamine-hydrolysing)